jgi:hypothetical protein
MNDKQLFCKRNRGAFASCWGSGGRGYGAAGFNNLTFALGGIADIHTVATPATGGTYAADGRLNYTDTARNNTLSVFNDANPNGAWALYFEDQSAGNVASLSSWSVNVTAVPEPATVALGVFGGLSQVAVAARRRQQLRERFSRLRTAFVQWLDAA